MSAFLHSWKFLTSACPLFVYKLRTPGSFAFVWEEGSGFWWPQMYPRDSAPRLGFNLFFLVFLVFSCGETINISFKYTIIKQAPCHAVVPKESLTLRGPNEIQIFQTHFQNVILHMTSLLHKRQQSSKQISYYIELKDRKKDDLFCILQKKNKLVTCCVTWTCRVSEAIEKVHRKARTKMMNENSARFL